MWMIVVGRTLQWWEINVGTGTENRRRLLFSRGLVGSSRRFHFPDPTVERPHVWIGMCPSAARHRLDIVPTICAFIRSLRRVELPGGGDLCDESALSNTNAGPNAGRCHGICPPPSKVRRLPKYYRRPANN